MPIVLNVAEKNDAAKNIANIMSRGTSRMRNSYSKYNKIYEFQKNLPSLGQSKMIFTSVAGHLLDKDFNENNRKWFNVDPLDLFEAPIVDFVPDNFKDIKRTLEKEARTSNVLIIWTDCDREGENIGFEIIKVCSKINPRLKILRAKFSQITEQAVNNAINNLVEPDKRQSDAVEVRRELDLRIGAAFTRFQTMNLQKAVQAISQAKSVVSYGSCQFPTLGFIVDRFLEIKKFEPQNFWFIEVIDERMDCKVSFNWKRHRLFDMNTCTALYVKVLEDPLAKVSSVVSKPTTRYRPNPMDTVQLEKLASSKLKISSKKTMTIAEKLYQKGIISYPRTETNIFPPDLKLEPLVSEQTKDNKWGTFAQRVLNDGIHPRQGKKTDKAHPPIHPLKHVTNLENDEYKVYELIVRHFLACVSSDAIGKQMTVKININGEEFEANGLNVVHRNFLEVYIYQKWSDKELPNYIEGSSFMPQSILQQEGKTTAPALLTEADLINLMEKNGIGTDATHAEHIETIQKRFYAEMNKDRRFLPLKLGLGLVNGYTNMGFELSKPKLRAALERDLQAICDGQKNPKVVLQDQIKKSITSIVNYRQKTRPNDKSP
ncbi:hypothetical protein RND71_043770 [Anisodus tanguticus]|uniref:DNA topoisomerase n=1 Tax=Anisodus tanguticus TaxID=243964 RepID=A0AAE1QNC3_9SOLA|nr:hypothetical protein RND71_043770 [Anisodus tanguticus]